MTNNYFTIASLFYSILLTIIYFKKEHIKTIETKIYSYIVITNLLNVICAILCAISILFMDKIPGINNLIGKTLIMFFFLWVYLFSIYVIIATNKEKDDKQLRKYLYKKRIILSIILLISIAVIYSLPLYYHNENKIIYSYGPSANFVYLATTLSIIFWIYKIITNYKILKDKKCIPIISFIFMTIFVVIIQKLNPGLLLITAMETFITNLMYHTIENPDLKLLTVMHNAKQSSDNANEEKTLFLYNMTQEIKKAISTIEENLSQILESNNIEEIKDITRDTSTILSKFNNRAMEVLNIDNISTSTVKVIQNQYNAKLLLKQLITKYKDKLNSKGLTFRYNVSKDMPTYLYGDSIRIKEVIDTILDTTWKCTTTGIIELNINSVVKHDVCRLIINIEDSGLGISNEEVEELMNAKSISSSKKNSIKANLVNAKNIIGKAGGILLYTSNYGKSLKVTIVLDQKIAIDETSNDTLVKNFDKLYTEAKKILICDSNESSQKILEKHLNKSNVLITKCTSGKSCLDIIREGQKYNLILISNEMEPLNGMAILAKLKQINNFNIPVVLMSKDSNVEYNNDYLQAGFNDIIIKPINKDTLLNIINKY